MKKSLKSEKPPTEEKESLNLKKPGKVPLINLQKSRLFRFNFSYITLTNVFGVDLNVDLAPEDVFLMYKKRDTVEKHYDTYKNMLEADKLYLQDNESLSGHLFISFLSLYGYIKIQNCIKKLI